MSRFEFIMSIFQHQLTASTTAPFQFNTSMTVNNSASPLVDQKSWDWNSLPRNDGTVVKIMNDDEILSNLSFNLKIYLHDFNVESIKLNHPQISISKMVIRFRIFCLETKRELNKS